MNRALTTVLGLAFGCSLLGLPACGSIDAEGEGAEFPPPIGYDEAMQAHASQPAANQTAAMSSPTEQPAPAPPLAPGEVPGSTSEAHAAVQPEQGDIVVGSDGLDYADTDPAALSDFRTTLDPYGSWVDDGTYGTVWQPSPTVVGNDFSPYVTAGHWTYDNEWVWASDYDWGWAPFHYGRWVYIGARGWSWIPGRTYAGAWVSWRYGYDGYGYIGWAPMAPSWYWYGGYAVGLAVVPHAPYVFCGYHDVFHPQVAGRIVTGQQVAVVAGHTHPYTPASPTVGGSGRTAAHPTVGGPPPSSLGLDKGQVAHVTPTDRGVMRAQQFAHPQSAVALGARAPTQFQAGPRVASAPAAGTRSSFAPSRSFALPSAAATAPRYQGIAPSPYRGSSPAYGAYGAYGSHAPSRSFGGGYAGASGAPRSYNPSYGGGYSAPHYGSMGSSPSFGGGYGSMYHPGGAVPGATSGSHAPPDYSSGAPHPSVHSGSGFRGGGSFHGGGGGGFHGGGGRR